MVCNEDTIDRVTSCTPVTLVIVCFLVNITFTHTHCTDCQNRIQKLVFVQYAFDRNEHSIELKPHGNSKKRSKVFSRSKPSTIKLLKKSAETNTPRKALQEVENLRGGIIGANSGCDLPQNRQQVYNLNYRKKSSQGHASCGSVQRSDVLAQVMHNIILCVRSLWVLKCLFGQLKLHLSLCAF